MVFDAESRYLDPLEDHKFYYAEIAQNVLYKLVPVRSKEKRPHGRYIEKTMPDVRLEISTNFSIKLEITQKEV